jgi:hypothetical protein
MELVDLAGVTLRELLGDFSPSRLLADIPLDTRAA